MTKTRPFILRPHEVLAALDGRLTMLWRPLNPQPTGVPHTGIVCDWLDCNVEPERQRYGFCDEFRDWASPCGGPGDLLWGRETWSSRYCTHEEDGIQGDVTFWRAGYEDDASEVAWRPSSIMPKLDTRIWLEVVEVQVRQVQSITEEEAKATGVKGLQNDDGTLRWRDEFVHQWVTHGNSWDANPGAWSMRVKEATRP